MSNKALQEVSRNGKRDNGNQQLLVLEETQYPTKEVIERALQDAEASGDLENFVLQSWHQFRRRRVADSWVLGQVLAFYKERQGHGNWLPWLRKHGISEDVAHPCMRLYHGYPDIPQLAEFDSVDAALKALPQARQTESETPEEAVIEVEEGEVEEGEVEVSEPADDKAPEAEVDAEDDEYVPRSTLPSMLTHGLEGYRTDRIKEGQRATVLLREDWMALQLAVPLPPWRGNTWQKWQPVALIEFKTKAKLTHTNGKMESLQINERRVWKEHVIELLTGSLDVEVLWKDGKVVDELVAQEREGAVGTEEENH